MGGSPTVQRELWTTPSLALSASVARDLGTSWAAPWKRETDSRSATGPRSGGHGCLPLPRRRERGGHGSGLVPGAVRSRIESAQRLGGRGTRRRRTAFGSDGTRGRWDTLGQLGLSVRDFAGRRSRGATGAGRSHHDTRRGGTGRRRPSFRLPPEPHGVEPHQRVRGSLPRIRHDTGELGPPSGRVGCAEKPGRVPGSTPGTDRRGGRVPWSRRRRRRAAGGVLRGPAPTWMRFQAR